MDDAANSGKRRKAEHRQMRVTDNPIGEMGQLIQFHIGLERALNADYQIKDYRHRDKTQADISGDPATSALRQHQVGNHYQHNDAQQERGIDRCHLRLHRNDGEDVVMGAVQRI